MKKTYVQCLLEMRLDNSVETLVAWIPLSLAQVGKRVVFRRQPLETWVVVDVYSQATEKDLNEMSRARRSFTQILGTDIENDFEGDVLFDCWGYEMFG